MRSTFTLCCALIPLCLMLGCRATEHPAAARWIPLFNGQNLDGWKVKIRGFEPGVNHSRARALVQNGALLLSRGTISLQAESHPVEFRSIELLPYRDALE